MSKKNLAEWTDEELQKIDEQFDLLKCHILLSRYNAPEAQSVYERLHRYLKGQRATDKSDQVRD